MGGILLESSVVVETNIQRPRENKKRQCASLTLACRIMLIICSPETETRTPGGCRGIQHYEEATRKAVTAAWEVTAADLQTDCSLSPVSGLGRSA